MDEIKFVATLKRMARAVSFVEPRQATSITNESNLIGGENVGSVTSAPAGATSGGDSGDDDGGGDGDPDPERRKARHSNKPHETPSPTSNAVGAQAHRLLLRREVELALRLSRSALYARIDPKSKSHDPDFPKPIRQGVGGRTMYWLATEVDAWIARRVSATRNAA